MKQEPITSIKDLESVTGYKAQDAWLEGRYIAVLLNGKTWKIPSTYKQK